MPRTPLPWGQIAWLTSETVRTWAVVVCALFLLAWIIGQHLKEERKLREAYDAAHAPLNQFLKDWGESEDARNHTT